MRTRPNTALRHLGGHPSSRENHCRSTAAPKRTSTASQNWSTRNCGSPWRLTHPAWTQHAPRAAWSLNIPRETL
jgi:hypothetical protein